MESPIDEVVKTEQKAIKNFFNDYRNGLIDLDVLESKILEFMLVVHFMGAFNLTPEEKKDTDERGLDITKFLPDW